MFTLSNFPICATNEVSIFVDLGFYLPIKQHNLIGPQFWDFSQELLLILPVGGGGRGEVGQRHNVYSFFDLIIWQFYKKYCLVWLQWEGVDG